jgi:hypothetical protein
MSEKEIREAIEEQEEHIKRVSSCRGERGVSHSFRMFGTRVGHTRKYLYSACVVCGVTEHGRDFLRIQEIRAGRELKPCDGA